jgi:hypothetical protein
MRKALARTGDAMQPIYITQSSVGSSPWHLANWHATGPQQFGFAVLSTGGSSGTIDVAMEDPQNVFPSPNSSLPTAFTFASWGASATFLSGFSSFAIAAYRLTMTTQSSAGAKATLVTLQSGIG